MTTLNDSLGTEKILIQAGAATVGRPSGTNGKKMFPRRSKMTTKEVESLKTKALKAGGPDSGRRSGGGLGKQTPLKDWKTTEGKPVHQSAHQKLIAKGYKFNENGKNNSTGQTYSHYIRKSDNSAREVTPDGKITNPHKND